MKTLIGQDLLKAVSSLCQRDMIVLPTETGYMLACNALDAEAVEDLLLVGDRNGNTTIELLLPSFESAGTFARDIPAVMNRIATRFSPGPISYLLDTKYVIPDTITCGLKRAAIRIPAHPLTLDLLRKVNFPVAAMAISALPTDITMDARHAAELAAGTVSYVLDGGVAEVGQESTLIAYEAGEVILYRRGAVSAEAIGKLTGMPVMQYLAPIIPEVRKTASLS